MEMNKDEAEKIVIQLQQAHRISVAFYRRILPLFDETAKKFGLGFYYWETLHTQMPPRSSTKPSSKWAWDFVPLYASRYVYKRSKDDKSVGKGDVGISFDLYVEDSFAPENRTRAGQPDSIEMRSGRAIVRAYIYRPNAEHKLSFDDWWDKEDSLEIKDGQEWHSVNEFADGVAIEWSLADVIADSQLMANTLGNFIEVEDRG